jgi:hypothetical protein
MLYRRVDGFSGNLPCFSILCAVFRTYVKLYSIFLFSDGDKVIVYVVMSYIEVPRFLVLPKHRHIPQIRCFTPQKTYSPFLFAVNFRYYT